MGKEKNARLTQLLNQLIEEANPHDQALLTNKTIANIERLEHALENNKHVPPDLLKAGLAKHVMNEVDEQMQANVDWSVITCRKGCSYCCHINVDMTDGEALLIIGHCKANNIPIDYETLRAQKDLDTTQRPRSAVSKCVFLTEEKTCSIYEVRPLNCRKHLVQQSPPEKCDSSVQSQLVGWNVEYNTEIMVSGLHSVMKNFGNMAEMILQQTP